jgi:hypothetical protein
VTFESLYSYNGPKAAASSNAFSSFAGIVTFSDAGAVKDGVL